MKKLFLTLCALVLFSTSAFASDRLAFVAGRVDDGFKLSAGVGTKILGITNYTYVNVGTYASISTEFGITTRYGPWTVGFLAGPNLDFGNGAGENLLTYLTGAGGVIGGYDVSETVGIGGYAKYKFDVEQSQTYVDGWEAGGGLYLRF